MENNNRGVEKKMNIVATGLGMDMLYMANAIIVLLVALVFLLIILVFFSVIFRWIRSFASKDERYNLFEIGALRKTADKAGIDLAYEKKLMELQNGKTFRRQLEEKIMKDTFKKEGEE